MKHHIRNLTVSAIALVVAGCASVNRDPDFPPIHLRTNAPERIRLKTFGSSGQHFSGVLMIDSERREISGITPAEFELQCIVLTGEVRKVDGDGSFGFMIERTEGDGRFYTPNLEYPCRFRYHHKAISIQMVNE